MLWLHLYGDANFVNGKFVCITCWYRPYDEFKSVHFESLNDTMIHPTAVFEEVNRKLPGRNRTV